MSITTINSTRVKPAARLGRTARAFTRTEAGYSHKPTNRSTSFHPAPCLATWRRRRRDFALPRSRCSGHPASSASPLGFAGHRIDRNAAQKFELLALGIHTLDQRIEIRRIVATVELGHEGMTVGRVFVAVDGVAHLPQVVPQFPFLFALGPKAGQGNSRGGKDGQDRNRHDQLDQGQARLVGLLRCADVSCTAYRGPIARVLWFASRRC